MTDASRIAVVVVNYRSPDLTAAAVRSVLSEPEVLEVVVVDNGAAITTAESLTQLTADPRVAIVNSADNVGFGRGVNLGVAKTTAPRLFILNSDATVTPGALGLLDLALDADHMGAVAPLVVDASGQPQPDAYGTWFTLGSMLRRTNRHPPETLDPDWLSGVAVLFRREAFESVGGFDAGYFMYLEDVDLCRRLRADGWDLRRCLGATVLHLGGRSLPSDEQRDAWYHESLVRAMRRSGQPWASTMVIRLFHPPWQWIERHRHASAQPGTH